MAKGFLHLMHLSMANLPEIIYRIGVAIPLFTEPDINGDSSFAPQDLIACTQVCRTWYSVLTPLCWHYFDDREKYFQNVPLPVLQANSRHFRYLTLSSPVALRSTLLRELVIYGESLIANMNLLHKNPQLESLGLFLLDDIAYREIQTALDTTLQLRILRVFCGKHPNIDHLVQFISNNTQLQDLELIDIVGVDKCVWTRPLMHLKDLRINTYLGSNPGLVDLIRQCPNLESLSFHARFGCPAETIARNIQECCPHLTSIRCLEGTSHRNRTWLLCNQEILLLLTATPRLVHFEMEMVELTAEIGDALAAHAQYLETVHIYVEGMGDTLVHGAKILADCPNLKSFALASACNAWAPKDGLVLLEQPWKSAMLESFWLDGIWYNGDRDDIAGDYEDFFEPDPDDLEKDRGGCGVGMNQESERKETGKILSRYGWEQEGRSCSDDHDALGSRYANQLLRRLLQRVVVMPKVRGVSVNKFNFVKKGASYRRIAF